MALSVLALTIASAPVRALAQSATYHLHKEVSTTSGAFQLKASGPDAAKTSIQSIDLKNRSTGEYAIKEFDTQPGVPNAAGAIPIGRVVSFTLWMKQTSNFGVMQPRARVRVNNANGAELCQVTGGTNLTTSLTAYSLSCVVASNVVMRSTDRLYVWIGVNLSSASGNHGAGGELDIEGTASGNYDSRLTVPLPLAPSISSLSPGSGALSSSVTIAGTNFGGAQGSSTVTFNGTLAVPTSWSATSITVAVPVLATTGPVVVRVGGASSNGVLFTVVPPLLLSISPTSGHAGAIVTLTGSHFLPAQNSSTVRFGGVLAAPTSWSDTSIVAPVPNGAPSGDIVVTIGNYTTNGIPFTVIVPGAVRGVVTRAIDASLIAGALVQAFGGGAVSGSATTSSGGTYTIAGLDPGAYDLRVTAPGYAAEVRRGVTVTSFAEVVANVAMMTPGGVQGTVTESDGISPIAGASITVYAGGLAVASATAGGGGAFGIAALHPGAYTVHASAVGYQAADAGVIVGEGAAAPANFSLTRTPIGSVSYVYDAIGRLTQATDPSGATAIYRYDEVGNVTAIERAGPGGDVGAAISTIAPTHGPAGTAVAISGIGFSANAALDVVTIGGASAAVISAAPEAIVALVPDGAVTGAVVVSSPNGSAVGPTPFVVTADAGAPTIASFTPTIGPTGTSVTVAGTNFDPVLANNHVTLNATWQSSLTSVASASLVLPVPAAAMGGRISVVTPVGSALSASDFFVTPPPYVASDVAVADRIAFGAGKTITIDAAGKIALLLFDGAAGQHISLLASNVAFTGDCITGSYTLAIIRPDGSTLASLGRGCSPGLFIDQQTLPISGSYTIVLDPILSNTGTLTLTLYEVFDIVGPISTNGTTVPVGVSTPGQNAALTFSGTAGQIVSATATSSNWTSCQFGGQYNFGMTKPDGSNLIVVRNACGPTTFIDHLTLPVTGTYTLWLDPYGANTGNATLAAYDVIDVTGPINTNGADMPVTIAVPGQNGRFTFAGVTGQIVSAWASASFWACTAVTFSVSIVNPDGSTLRSAGNWCGSAFTDQVTLPIDGTYTVVIDPSGINTGNATLRLFTMVDVTQPITINGPSVPITITTPFQNARLTFAGTAGQTVSASATSSTWTGCVTTQFDLYLVKPDGSTLASTFGCWGSAALGQKTLPVSGTYTIRVDPRELNTGTATVLLTSP